MRLSGLILGAATAAALSILGSPAARADNTIGLLASRADGSRAFSSDVGRPRDNETKKDQLARIFTPNLVDQLWMNDYPDLDAACERGWLVDVPDDPAGLGVHIRKSGNCPVGEKEHDLARRAKLYRLAKPAAGLLYRIAAHLRETEGSAFVPLQVSSLVRPWSYQKKLMASNANANTIRAGVPPTHVFGLAFDLPRGDMPAARERILQRYLDSLADAGTVVYFKEGKAQATFHVIAMPAAHEALEADFYELTARAAHSPTSLVCAGDSNPEFLHDEIWW
ncbi:MAG: hypothetical protein HY899_06140 [Deltaproteobacteria bacterium]|nr:hypothetical protein [Deltaproteobacteria bacterium]